MINPKRVDLVQFESVVSTGPARIIAAVPHDGTPATVLHAEDPLEGMKGVRPTLSEGDLARLPSEARYARDVIEQGGGLL